MQSDASDVTGSFWTNRQRQASSLHEVPYRACFKPQLPKFFIERYSSPGDTVFDPFSGRGTTAVEAALLLRTPISNDTNPLSEILTRPRLEPPGLDEVARRLSSITVDYGARAGIDLSMFYHPRTEAEVVSLRDYLMERRESGKEDRVDRWIRMVATTRLTGHSSGFFSVYSLPPNQAASPEEQERINRRLGQEPEYRDVKKIVLRKSASLLRDVSPEVLERLSAVSGKARFTSDDSRDLVSVGDGTVDLTVTSPPFINLVDYAKDNWMRLWFNCIDAGEVKGRITVLSDLGSWKSFISATMRELFRITKPGGYVAFEVGETRKADLKEIVRECGTEAGLEHVVTYINVQRFTKTSHIWGVENNRLGTNTNRIVLFRRPAHS
ncbi:DNA methylase [Thermogymnomonas acidicola]|uniref:site-specific DNA-methyltransferase (cytosine-N(4)-specific) n=1 Tax=Thermogymnomonas acidicola TaxID=399579 RepID=A0AA37F9S2_9ARCH|nr:DNA methyltransferase [Thermogymnomonas acidicola]GGM77073.1 DNA methylase [Thermogymnomonas acidicola]